MDRFARENWRIFDRQLEKREMTLEECLRRQFASVSATQAAILGEIDRVALIRPDFGRLVECCMKHRLHLVFASAGIDFVIKHILNQRGWLGLVDVYAPKAEVTANGIKLDFPALFDKSSVNFIDDLVWHYRKHGLKVIYVGDGIADYETPKNADFAFAIKKSKLAELLSHGSIPHREISDFREVIEVIKGNSSRP